MKRYFSIKNIIAIVFIATVIKFWANAFVFDNGVAWNYPSASILSSKATGLFVCPVQVSPNELDWKGTKVSFKDVWIEREVKTEFSYIWLYTPKYSGEYILCFTLDQGKEAFVGLRAPFFTIDGAGQGFTSFGGNKLFYSELSPSDFPKHNIGVSIIEDWTDSRDHHVEFTW